MIKSGNSKSATARGGREAAEALAVEALSFIAADGKLLERFMGLSGLGAETLRQAAQSPGFLAGVLSFLLNHEPDLIAFCEQTGHQPESIARAFALLPGGNALNC